MRHRKSLALVCLCVIVTLSGCGTLAGFGEDLTSLSNGISGKQDENIRARDKYRPIVP